MAETYRYITQEPAKLLFSSVTKPSAPRGLLNVAPKFSATFGLSETDFKNVCDIMKKAIKAELGSFSSPDQYHLACMSGAVAGNRAMAKAELEVAGKSEDERFKHLEKIQKRVEMYNEYAGVLNSSSKYSVGLSRIASGKIIDITDPLNIAAAGDKYFYPGAFVAACIEFKPYRRKTVDAKDGVTCFLKQVLFLKDGDRMGRGSASGSTTFADTYGNYSDVNPIDYNALEQEIDDSPF